MHACRDEVVAKPPQNIALYLSGNINGGNEIRKNTMESFFGHRNNSITYIFTNDASSPGLTISLTGAFCSASGKMRPH
jgi:hypothetical protein